MIRLDARSQRRARVKLHLIQFPLSCDLWLVGAAFSLDLPGQSRLKTAPTIKNNKVSFSIKLAAYPVDRLTMP